MVSRAWSMSFRFEISEVTEWMVLERINSNRFEMSRMSGFTHKKFSFSMEENPLMIVCYAFNRMVFWLLSYLRCWWLILLLCVFFCFAWRRIRSQSKRTQLINLIRNFLCHCVMLEAVVLCDKKCLQLIKEHSKALYFCNSNIFVKY